jgi:hypothetical protein
MRLIRAFRQHGSAKISTLYFEELQPRSGEREAQLVRSCGFSVAQLPNLPEIGDRILRQKVASLAALRQFQGRAAGSRGGSGEEGTEALVAPPFAETGMPTNSPDLVSGQYDERLVSSSRLASFNGSATKAS